MLRAVQIDLFDGQGNPRDDAPFWFKAKLSLTLTADEIEQIGGLGTVLGQFSTIALTRSRLEPLRAGAPALTPPPLAAPRTGGRSPSGPQLLALAGIGAALALGGGLLLSSLWRGTRSGG